MFKRKRKNIKNTGMDDDDDMKASALLEMLNIFFFNIHWKNFISLLVFMLL
jgi:hypothetical protein